MTTVAGQLAEALSVVAARCDGARLRDGQGFDGVDTAWGRAMSHVPPEAWTPDQARHAWVILGKYRAQLARAGIDYDGLLEPPASNVLDEADTRIKVVDTDGTALLLRFGYDAALVDSLREVPLRRWIPDEAGGGVWRVSSASVAQVERWAARHRFVVTPTARAFIADPPPPPPGEAGRCFVEGDVVVCEFPPNDEANTLVRAIDGRHWDSLRRVWTVPLEWGGAVAAIGARFGWDVPAELAAMPVPAQVKVNVVDGMVFVKFRYTVDLTNKLRAVPGAAWSGAVQAWMVPIEELAALTKALDGYTTEGFDPTALRRESDRVRRMVDMSVAIDAEIPEIPGFAYWELGNRRFGDVCRHCSERIVHVHRAGPARGVGPLGPRRVDGGCWRHEVATGCERPEPDFANFQRAAIAYVREARRTFVSMKTGLGKTVSALAALQLIDAHDSPCFPAVAVPPAGLKFNWVREIRRFLPERNVLQLDGLIKDSPAWRLMALCAAHARAAAGEEARPAVEWAPTDIEERLFSNGCELCRGATPLGEDLCHADLVVINYDIIRPDSEVAGGPRGWTSVLSALHPAALVVDESHYVKSSDAMRTRACVELSRSMAPNAVRINLTATPVLNQRVEYASQLDILRRLEEFGTEYAVAHMDDINRRLKARCYYRIRHDQVGLDVPCPWIIVDVPGDPAVMADYARAEEDLLRYLGDKAAAIAAATGFDPDSAAMEARMRAGAAEALVRITALKHLAARAKLPAAIEWVKGYLEENPESKLLPFGHHTDVLDDLALALRSPRLGDAKGSNRERLIDRFQTEKALRVLLCEITAAGVGLTLTAADDVLFLEQAWSPATHNQNLARAAGRLNDLHGATGFFMLCEGTIDHDIHELLLDKAVEIDDATEGDDAPDGKASVLGDLVVNLTHRALARKDER